jgi:hypothetical protein
LKQLRRFVVLAGGSIALLAAAAASPADRALSEAQPPPGVAGDFTPAVEREVLGLSGNLRALIGTPAALERDDLLKPLLAGVPIRAPGVHPLGLTAPDRESLVVVSMEPLGALNRARLAAYRVGRWPSRGLAARDPRYSPPPGYIAVTPENASTVVSKRFRLRDFLTHDQQDVWPKVLVLRVALLDKLELIANQLASEGASGALHIMSGFRTPQYNALGVVPNGGRSGVSRHMYGDAADVFVDADGDGRMDDLDGDGRVTIRDARVLLAVAVESLHPDLAGGLSAYPGNSAHGPFVHIDVRGTKARW